MRLTIIFILYFNSGVLCQNLVPNSSFEEVGENVNQNSCGHYNFEKMIKHWFAPPGSYPTVISLGHKEGFIKDPQVKTGSFALGISTDKMKWEIDGEVEFRNRGEYVGVKLTEAMSPLRTYYVEYWIRRIDCSNPVKDNNEILNRNYGILLTADSIVSKEKDMLIGQPQIIPDSQLVITNRKWEKISKYVTPDQEYNYLYFGQFVHAGSEQKDVMIGYYVLDDITIVEVSDFSILDKNMHLPTGSIIPLNAINFLSGTTDLSDQKSYEELSSIVEYLNKNPDLNICINGHTDSVGNARNNIQLSINRAKVIAELIIQSGISKSRIEWKGFGEGLPLFDNADRGGRAKNRRVEFEIIE